MPASPPIKTMPSPSSHPVKAVLGPTNTGKTHLAVERLTAHASGMMGFPLRLLAREVYDRVVAIKGPAEVALVTGEERIRSEEHTSELQSLMRISYAVFTLNKKKNI